ncbi:MAG: nucleotidyltransferase domain-containing protein [Clostridiales bacterium]|nr:nucleotidyltransferase domain-containing protein [Clostridiales bacterium]
MRDRLLKIILYGSYARGDYNSDSDVDIMALADLSEDERRVIQKRINKIASDISLKHDITVSISLRSLNMYTTRVKYVPFYRNVHTEGVEIYAV